MSEIQRRRKMSNHSTGKFVVGAFIGAAVGAVVGLLFAPKSGKETRKWIGEKAKDYAKEGKKVIVEKEKEAKEAISKVAQEISK